MNCQVCDQPSMVMNAGYLAKVPFKPREGTKAITCGSCIAKGQFKPGDEPRLPREEGE